jgi:hypothetical protein
MCVPILSYNAPTNNVLLKITVPKRIGRKRKRGALDPSLYADTVFSPLSETGERPSSPTLSIGSQSRKDNPAELLRALKENVGNYSIEAVAEITNTHRFRGTHFVVAIYRSADNVKVSRTFTTPPAIRIFYPDFEIRFSQVEVRLPDSLEYARC